MIPVLNEKGTQNSSPIVYSWSVCMFIVVDTAHILLILQFLPHSHEHDPGHCVYRCNDMLPYVCDIILNLWKEHPVFDITPQQKSHSVRLVILGTTATVAGHLQTHVLSSAWKQQI